MRILVGYASKYGSTQDVAERIAARLTDRGFEAEMRRLDPEVDLDIYDAAIIGSAVYGGAWLPNAVAFTDRCRNKLAGLPVWLFTVGRLDGQRGLMGTVEWPGAKELSALETAIDARGSTFFAGAIFKQKLPLVVRALFRGMGGRYGDFRDWPKIDAWADEIADTLATPVERTSLVS